jgi:hypothetical protein
MAEGGVGTAVGLCAGFEYQYNVGD